MSAPVAPPIIETEPSADTDTSWYAGYSLILPCDKKTPPCDREAEWFANQHGCIRAHLCEEHMIECYWDVVKTIVELGSVRCPVCGQHFQVFTDFITAAKI